MTSLSPLPTKTSSIATDAPASPPFHSHPPSLLPPPTLDSLQSHRALAAAKTLDHDLPAAIKLQEEILLLCCQLYGKGSGAVCDAVKEVVLSINSYFMEIMAGINGSSVSGSGVRVTQEIQNHLFQLLEKSEILTNPTTSRHLLTNERTRLKLRSITLNNLGYYLVSVVGRPRCGLKYLTKLLRLETMERGNDSALASGLKITLNNSLPSADVQNADVQNEDVPAPNHKSEAPFYLTSTVQTHINISVVLGDLKRFKEGIRHARFAIKLLHLEEVRNNSTDETIAQGSAQPNPTDYSSMNETVKMDSPTSPSTTVDRTLLSTCYYNLAFFHLALKNYESSIKYYKLAYVVLKGIMTKGETTGADATPEKAIRDKCKEFYKCWKEVEKKWETVQQGRGEEVVEREENDNSDKNKGDDVSVAELRKALPPPPKGSKGKPSQGSPRTRKNIVHQRQMKKRNSTAGQLRVMKKAEQKIELYGVKNMADANKQRVLEQEEEEHVLGDGNYLLQQESESLLGELERDYDEGREASVEEERERDLKIDSAVESPPPNVPPPPNPIGGAIKVL